MRFTLRLSAAFFAFVLLFAGTAEAQKYSLKFAPQAGERIAWDIIMEMDMNMKPTGMDMEMDMNMDMGVGMSIEITEGPDKEGLVDMKTSVDSMRMNMSGMPGMSVAYNSNRQADDPMASGMADALNPLFEAEILQTIDAQGQVVSTTGLEELQKALGEGGSGMSGMSSNPYENFQSYMVAFPKKKVKVGDSWEQEVRMSNNGMPMDYANTYTLLGVDGDVANIKVEGSILMEEGEIEQNGMAMTMSMSGTQNGTMRVRLSDGMTQRVDMVQNLSMDMQTMGMAMPATIKSNIQLKPIQP
jgi:hypothetical protein